MGELATAMVHELVVYLPTSHALPSDISVPYEHTV